MPDFSTAMDDILDYAVRWLDMLDDQRFLWVVAAFSMVTATLLWIIDKVRNPPDLNM
jgi:hypothetical protein